MKELSIFIDESGDFGPFDKNSINYIVTFVLHSQSINLDEEISKLNNKLLNIDSNIEYIHLGPIIRREAIFSSRRRSSGTKGSARTAPARWPG